MNQAQIIDELQRNKVVFESLLKGTDEKQFRWKPKPDKWCLLEVICHLFDEEREDFRARLKHCLENPASSLPPINPVGWVKERKYIEQNFEEKLKSFLMERNDSISWLESLKTPKWENALKHPQLGKMSANKFLSNWLAHDYIHIRQIIKIKYAFLDAFTDDSLNYAGDW